MDGALVFRELTLFSVVVRCLAAVLLGGVIGLERGLKPKNTFRWPAIPFRSTMWW